MSSKVNVHRFALYKRLAKYAPCTFKISQPYNYTFKPFHVNRRRAATPGAMLCCHSPVLHYLSLYHSKLLVTLQINLYMLTNTTVHIPTTIHMFLYFKFILNLIIVNRIKCINIQFFILKLYKYTEIKRGCPIRLSSFMFIQHVFLQHGC